MQVKTKQLMLNRELLLSTSTQRKS